jgi:hypothetical protein
MANAKQEEYEAKLTDVEGVPRGRVPMKIVQHLKGRVGDYIVFRISQSGVITVALRRQTAGKKKAAKINRK